MYAINWHIQNFTRLDYNAASQNWAVCFDDDGYTYFGNDRGLLVYDGDNWELHSTDNHTVVKSLYFDKESGRVYSGGYRDFGYWEKNQLGKLAYHSIVPNAIKASMNQELIWCISRTKTHFYFQSYQNIYVHEISGNEWSVVHDVRGLMHSTVRDTIYVAGKENGVMTISEDDNSAFIGTSPLEANFFLPWDEHKLLVGSYRKGLYLLENSALRPWQVSANNVLKQKTINRGIAVNDSTYLIATLDDGMYLLSNQGRILEHINQKNGLINNTILDVVLGPNQQLFVATDNGISIVHLDAEIKYHIDITNNLGHITQVLEFNDYTYIGTNNGLYFMPKKYDPSTFDFNALKRMPQVNGHIWYIKQYDGKVFCGANNGLFEITGTKATLITKIGGGSTALIQLPEGDGYLSAFYYRMGIIKARQDGPKAGQLYCVGLIEGFDNTCTTIAFDAQNKLWACGEEEGLYQMSLDVDKLRFSSVKSFDQSNGLSNLLKLNVANIDGHIVVSAHDGFYIYDSINDKLIPYDKLNSLLQEGQVCTQMTIQDDKHFWISTLNSAMLIVNNNGIYETEKSFLFTGKYSFPDKFQNVSILKNKTVFSLDKGLAVFDRSKIYTYKKFPLIITAANSINQNTSKSLPVVATSASPVSLAASSNNLDLHYFSVNQTPSLLRYKWRLLDSDKKDASWNHTFDSHVSLSNLDPGSYTLEIKVIYYDQTESDSCVYAFEVKRPFLFTREGLLVIFLILVVVLIITYRVYSYLLHRNERRLKLTHAHEMREKKAEIKELQNDLMKKQVEQMHTELTMTNNALVQKDEALLAVKKSVDDVFDHLGGRFPRRDYDRIMQVLNQQMSHEQDRKEFERHFQQSQEGVYRKLRELYPELTNNEMRLCSLLRMNMNTKEIAERLRISPKSAEVGRYRLRKKLGLSSDVNLSKFLQEKV